MRWCMAAIVMGSSFRLPWLHGKYRLGAVKCLNLRLFVDTKHQRSLGRIQVKPDHVSYLLDEQRVVRELEGLRAVRLEAKGSPDARDSHRTQPRPFRHLSGAPVCGSLRLALQRQGDHLLHLLVRNLARRTGSGSSNNPSIPRAMNRDRHFPTVRGDTLSLAATTLLSRPRAQLSTIADRTARPCAVLRRRR